MPDAEPDHDTTLALKDVSDSSHNFNTGDSNPDELEIVRNCDDKTVDEEESHDGEIVDDDEGDREGDSSVS